MTELINQIKAQVAAISADIDKVDQHGQGYARPP